jgi:hypothetical protein
MFYSPCEMPKRSRMHLLSGLVVCLIGYAAVLLTVRTLCDGQ